MENGSKLEPEVRDYDQYWADLTVSHASHPGNRYRYELIANELNKHGVEPRSIIDCGCGDGSLLKVMAQAYPKAELYGMDIASNVPINLPGGPIRFYQQDLARTLPSDLTSRFDLVLCSEVIEHVPNDGEVVANLASLLRPGGWVVLTTQTGNIYKTEQYLGHVRHYQLADLSSRLQNAGLRVEAAFPCGWPWLNLQKIVAHHLQGAVQKQVVQARKLKPHIRGLFFVLTNVYRFSSRRDGPQLFLLAQKPESQRT